MSRAKEILKLLKEELSPTDAKHQAEALLDYLNKAPGSRKPEFVPELAKLGAKWFNSKDFAPEDIDAILAEYEKLKRTDNVPSSSDISSLIEANERPSQQADDKENQELAKLAVEQNNLLKEIYKHVAAGANAANAYNQWLTKNDVQSLLGKNSEQSAEYIKADAEEILRIV